MMCPSIDWEATRRLDIATVAIRLLGPPSGRPGDRSSRLWWRCPFHDDKNPSFTVMPGGTRFKCFGCSEQGDTVDLVAKREGMTKADAARYLLGDQWVTRQPTRRSEPPQKPERSGPKLPPDSWRRRALELVSDCEPRLWQDEGVEGLAHLLGRGLNHETIKAERIGFNPHYREGLAQGIVIPWFDGQYPIMVQVRRPPGSDPKYMAMAGGGRAGAYPGLDKIQTDLPLVIAEGELDCLLLGQELQGLASVVTLGSASETVNPALLLALLPVNRRFIATHNDTAGDKAASRWLDSARCRRLRPPAYFNDWTEAYQGGINLRRWWGDIIAGIDNPKLHTWEELETWRW